jgi:putative N6-adenine-specific DNA methylase
MKENITHTQSFFASCPVGMEQLLLKELQNIGAQQPEIQRGGVDFTGDDLLAIKAILHSRVASRVYKRLWSFEAGNEKEIYKKALELDWKSVIDIKQTFKMRTIFEHGAKTVGKFKNSMYASQILKDALADNFRTNFGVRPSVDKDNADVEFVLRLRAQTASILLNICGAPLNQREYRTVTTEAPIKENLAAGLIALSNWNPDKDPFVDSMCGSGTFCIEAAMLKANIPPSFLKLKKFIENGELPWSFLKHLYFENDAQLKDLFKEEAQKILEKIYKRIDEIQYEDPTIFGFDIDPSAVITAKTNLKAARLDKLVSISRGNASKITPPSSAKKGVIMCNPPYGERLGATQELRGLYIEYGTNLKRNFRDWRAFVFTGSDHLAKLIPLKPTSRTKLFNGDIECFLIEYSLH